MSIIGIDHLAIGVHDLDASERVWCERFGATVTRRTTNETLGIRQVYVAFPEGSQLELFSPVDDSSPMAAVLDEQGEGFRALSLMVDDVQEALADLTSKGVRTFTHGDVVFLHPASTNGLVISLMPRP